MQSSKVPIHTSVLTNIDLFRYTCNCLTIHDQSVIARTCSSTYAAISSQLHYCIRSSSISEVTQLFATTFQNTCHSQLSIQLHGYHKDLDWEKPMLDMSVMAHVDSLEVSIVHITNVSALGRVKTLNICNCLGVTDVSALGGVHTLTLSMLPITDVSALGGVHTLHLPNCFQIKDVSALGGVHTLTLSGSEITDVSALGGVHTLDLSNCFQIKDVSALGRVHTLHLSDCFDIVDVSALGRVHTLNLSKCSSIEDVSALGNVHTLI
jgi:hypothetical protein